MFDLTLTGRFVGGGALGDAHLRRHRHIPVRDSGCSPVHRRAVRGWWHERLGQLAGGRGESLFQSSNGTLETDDVFCSQVLGPLLVTALATARNVYRELVRTPPAGGVAGGAGVGTLNYLITKGTFVS